MEHPSVRCRTSPSSTFRCLSMCRVRAPPQYLARGEALTKKGRLSCLGIRCVAWATGGVFFCLGLVVVSRVGRSQGYLHNGRKRDGRMKNKPAARIFVGCEVMSGTSRASRSHG